MLRPEKKSNDDGYAQGIDRTVFQYWPVYSDTGSESCGCGPQSFPETQVVKGLSSQELEHSRHTEESTISQETIVSSYQFLSQEEESLKPKTGEGETVARWKARTRAEICRDRNAEEKPQWR